MPTTAARRGTLARLAGVAGSVGAAGAAVAVAATLTGCASASSGTHHAGVATQLGLFSAAPMPSVAVSRRVEGPTAATSEAPSWVTSPPALATMPASGSAGPAGFASPTPCPPPAPQQFVEGKSAMSKAGTIVFSYVDAEKLCGGPDDGQYIATTSVVTSAAVDPAAVVLVLPPDGSTRPLQIPAAALPAAMKANNQAPFYAITYGPGAGPIVRIEQYFHP